MQQSETIKEPLAPGEYLFTADETRQYIRCSRTKLWRLRKQGKLKAILSGRQILFLKSSITEYLTTNPEGSNHG